MRFSNETNRVAATVAAALFGLAACNSISGAGDIVLNPELGADDATSTGSGSSSATGENVTAGPTSGTTVGAGSTGTEGAGAAGSTSMAASTTGAGAAGPEPCEYPPGPYGVGMNETVPPTLSWQGYAPGAASPSTITIEQLYDCDGSRGIHALYFDTSQFG